LALPPKKAQEDARGGVGKTDLTVCLSMSSWLLLLLLLCSLEPGCLGSRPNRGLLHLSALESFEELAESYRYATVRIMMVERTVDWLRPYAPGEDLTFIGSGFAASLTDTSDIVDAFDMEDPIFITNAHVVQNAHTVLVQMPSVSKAQFPAYVPVIYEEMDLAVVRLVFPQVFTQFLKANNKKVMVLPIRSSVKVEMGMEVAALGFPLGCERLKLSRGVIAGTEQVSGHVRYQSTAPISPGSSGGPLLKLSESDGLHTTVVGVNFAAASSVMAQNANYVVPAVHIAQLLTELKKRAPEERERIANISAALQGVGSSLQELFGSTHREGTEAIDVAHTQLRVGALDVLKVEGNDALYNTYGCTGAGGVFISQVGRSSVLQNAWPPLEAESFLYEVNAVRIDRFGNGAEEGAYLDDPIPFDSIMYEMENLATNVTVKTCKDGKNRTHTVSMQWRPEYEPGVRSIFEPYFEPQALYYEAFANVFVMQLNAHHLWALLDYLTLPLLGPFMQRGQEPRLVVCSVVEGSYAQRVLVPGMVLSTLNGQKVTTLDDFRSNFEPAPEDGKPWRLVMESGEIFEVSFLENLQSQLQMIQEGMRELNTTAVWAAFLRRVALQELHEKNTSIGAPRTKTTLDRLEAEAYRRGYEKALQEVQERVKQGNQPVLTETSAATSNGSHETGFREKQVETVRDVDANRQHVWNPLDESAVTQAALPASLLQHLPTAEALPAELRSARSTHLNFQLLQRGDGTVSQALLRAAGSVHGLDRMKGFPPANTEKHLPGAGEAATVGL